MQMESILRVWGFVPIAVVSLSSAGITNIRDIRTFFNIFDPDFFTVYGRRNINFSVIYDNTNLIELPYNFTDLVPKIEQVDIRKFENSRLDSTVSTTDVQHDYDFTLNEPTIATQTTIQRRDFLNTTTEDGVVSYETSSLQGYQEINSTHNFGIYNRFFGRTKFNESVIININLQTSESRENSQNVIDSIPSHIYIHLWKSSEGEPSLTNSIVYEIPKEDFIFVTGFDGTPSGQVFTNEPLYSPIFSSENLSNEFNRIRVSTENPVTFGSGVSNYVDPASSIAIPNFFSISEVIYNPNTRRFSFDLIDTTIGTVSQTFSGTRDLSKGFDLVMENDDPLGLWSNGSTLWVLDRADRRVYAYNLSNGSRDSSSEFNLASDNNNPSRIWSDGTTMWVLDRGRRRLFAYTLGTGVRDNNREFDLHADNNNPTGLWSDDTTIYVSDRDDSKVFAYILATGVRDESKEFDLDSNNDNSTGLWSDGTTMWVADRTDSLAYAYNLSGGARNTSREFTISDESLGLWSDGTTLYTIAFVEERIYAYTLFTTSDSFASEIDTNRIFSNIVLRKGTDIRLSKNLSDLTIVVNGNTANFSYGLLASETFILATDTVFNDFNLEFNILQGDIGIPTRITIPLVQTRDFTIVEEAGRTYARLNDQLGLRTGEQLLFSHIIPQTLIPLEEGNPENDTFLRSLISDLEDEIQMLRNRVVSNEGEIDDIQNTIGRTSSTLVQYAFGLVETEASNDPVLALAKATSYVNSLGSYVSNSVSNLKTSGSLLNIIAPSQVGFYHLIVLIEESEANNLRFRNDTFDETDLWTKTALTRVISGITYSVYVRNQTLADNDVINLVIKGYD